MNRANTCTRTIAHTHTHEHTYRSLISLFRVTAGDPWPEIPSVYTVFSLKPISPLSLSFYPSVRPSVRPSILRLLALSLSRSLIFHLSVSASVSSSFPFLPRYLSRFCLSRSVVLCLTLTVCLSGGWDCEHDCGSFPNILHHHCHLGNLAGILQFLPFAYHVFLSPRL
jgi:hypothetical protein